VSDVLDLEEEALASHHVEVTREIALGAVAVGDVEKLKQVALNLVMNALDAMPEQGALRVAVGGDATEVWMEVSDTGPGIDPTILAEIFDPFFTTKAAGTGLGLAIVDHTMRGHGGSVSVESEPGQGSTFTLAFPIPASSAEAYGDRHEAHSGDRGRAADAARPA